MAESITAASYPTDVVCSQTVLSRNHIVKALRLRAAKGLLSRERLTSPLFSFPHCLAKAEQNKDSHSIQSKNEKRTLSRSHSYSSVLTDMS